MTKLEAPDSFHLLAAVGWLELGNHIEAGEELARIKPELWEEPDVLEIRWSVCAAGQSWDTASEVAELLVCKAPERSSGWIHRAYALRRAKGGGLQKAWEALRPAFDNFPKASLIPYNLACYAAQFGKLDEAWDWLHKAMEAEGDVNAILNMALKDTDLKALWDKIAAARTAA